MQTSVILVVCAVSVAFGAIWFYRRIQLRNLHRQIHYYRLLARQLAAMRERTDIPGAISSFVEELAEMPLDSTFVRIGVHRVFQKQHHRHDSQGMALRVALRGMNPDAVEAFQKFLVTFVLSQSYSSLFYGIIYRRLWVGFLGRDAAAEVAVDALAQQRYRPAFSAI